MSDQSACLALQKEMEAKLPPGYKYEDKRPLITCKICSENGVHQFDEDEDLSRCRDCSRVTCENCGGGCDQCNGHYCEDCRIIYMTDRSCFCDDSKCVLNLLDNKNHEDIHIPVSTISHLIDDNVLVINDKK